MGTKAMLEDKEVDRRHVRDLQILTCCMLLEESGGEIGMAIACQERSILMDVQLSKGSGIETARVLRGAPATAYMAKPYSPRGLFGLIRRLLPEGGEPKT